MLNLYTYDWYKKNECYWYGNQGYPVGLGGWGLKSPKEEIESLKGKDGIVRWEVSNLQDGK